MSDSNTASKTRIWALVAILAVAAASWGALGGWARLFGSGPAGRLSNREANIPFNPSTWAWRGEEHWAVDQTVQDVSEMLLYAAHERPGAYTIRTEPLPHAVHAYKVSVQGPKLGHPIEQTLVLQHFLWDPADYAALVHELRGQLGLEPGVPHPDLERKTLDSLLTPTSIQIERTQQAVSAALNQAPTSAEVHESAGAVLAVFGLYDESCTYLDHRLLLCRLSAHMALASEFRSNAPGPGAALSRLGLLALTSQSAMGAEEALAMRKQQPLPLAEPWLNALYMRITGDWRGVGDPAKATLAEALASFAGRCEIHSSDEAWTWIKEGLAGRSPEFVHHMAFRWAETVGMSRTLMEEAIPTDLESLEAVRLAREPGQRLSRGALIKTLNSHPGRAFNPETKSLEVLDWGAWAQRFQANLLDDMDRSLNYYEDKLGSKEDAVGFLHRIEREYAGLEQFPVLEKRYISLDPSMFRKAAPRAIQLAREHPEVISDANFVTLSLPKEGWTPPPSMPRYTQWLSLPLPFGTTYNLLTRFTEMQDWWSLSLEARLKLHDQDPYNLPLTRICIDKQFGKDRPTVEVVEALYAPTKAFAPRAYLDELLIAYPTGAPEKIPVLQKMAELDPTVYFALARALVVRGREQEALQAFLKGHDLVQDRINVSNNMLWTVLYLYRHGQREKAAEIAEECGDVYSAAGLQTLAVLRELQGRIADAKAVYAASKERYDREDDGLFGFYARNAGRDPELKVKYEAWQAKVFPAGMKPFDLASEPARPTKGTVLTSTPGWVREAGIRYGCVIVAIDGHKVENSAQYAAARSLALQEEMDLVIFQDGKYQDLKVDVPHKLFGVGLRDYAGR